MQLTACMRATAPGVMEYELAAVLEYHYRVSGARGASYHPIVAGGTNAWYGHYNANDAPLADGDLVLVDCAPDHHYYTSDITRMWPVNGTYSDTQRALYGFMIAYHKALLAGIRPGRTDDEIHREAAQVMAAYLDRSPFANPVHERAARSALEFPHHLSHPVGMAVHDVSHYRGKPLRPGIVFSVDPQMRIPEERLYLRVEDTVVVTEDRLREPDRWSAAGDGRGRGHDEPTGNDPASWTVVAQRASRCRMPRSRCLLLLPRAQRPISGTSRPRQILRASVSATSECLGTASASPFSGLIHGEWDPPSRFR